MNFDLKDVADCKGLGYRALSVSRSGCAAVYEGASFLSGVASLHPASLGWLLIVSPGTESLSAELDVGVENGGAGGRGNGSDGGACSEHTWLKVERLWDSVG